MKLSDAYFGIRRYDFNTGELEIRNLFGSYRVLDSIAIYKTRKEVRETHKDLDSIISFCFGDVRGHVEYEYEIKQIFTDKETEKIDTYRLYVEPNKELLYKIVKSISVTSCREYLREMHRRRGL